MRCCDVARTASALLHVAAVNSSWSFETKLVFLYILVQSCSWSAGFLCGGVPCKHYERVWVPVLTGRAGQPTSSMCEGRSMEMRHGNCL